MLSTKNLRCQSEIPLLETGKLVERELKGGEVQAFRIKLVAGQFLQAVADQKGVDVVATLFAPGGEKLWEVDSPNGTSGPEVIWCVADVTGDYRLEIWSLEKDAKPGGYAVIVKQIRAANDDDRYFVSAEKEIVEAGTLIFGTGTDEARKEATAHFLKAATLARSIQKKDGRAKILANVGRVAGSWNGDLELESTLLREAAALYEESGQADEAAHALSNVGDIQVSDYKLRAAVETYERALAIVNAADDKKSQTAVLINMATAFDLMGDKESAIKRLNLALKISE
ncbi:MAG TPA: tetratricopeptide repeat protein, partial [Pyrinomonadaceae bacterium]|nr:tetratricopeptide repeat protein [Pyrinomonadaceae bacterium]